MPKDNREIGAFSEAEKQILEVFPQAVIELDDQQMIVVHTNWWVHDGGYKVTEREKNLAV